MTYTVHILVVEMLPSYILSSVIELAVVDSSAIELALTVEKVSSLGRRYATKTQKVMCE